MANDSHTGRYPAAVEIYYSVCKPYCAFFAQNTVTDGTVRLKQVKFHHIDSTYVQVKLYPYGMQNSQLYVKFCQDILVKN